MSRAMSAVWLASAADRAGPGHDSFDQRGRLAVEGVGDRGDAIDPLRFRRALRRDALGHGRRFDRTLTQFLDRLRHPADLVGAPARGHSQIALASGKPADHLGQHGDGADDAAAQQRGHASGNGNDEHQHSGGQPQREEIGGAVSVGRLDGLGDGGVAHRQNILHRRGILHAEVPGLDAVDTVGTGVLFKRFVELSDCIEVTRSHHIERRDEPRPRAGARNGSLNPDPGLVDACGGCGQLLHAVSAKRLLRPECGIEQRRRPRRQVAHLPTHASDGNEAGAFAIELAQRVLHGIEDVVRSHPAISTGAGTACRQCSCRAGRAAEPWRGRPRRATRPAAPRSGAIRAPWRSLREYRSR